MLSSGSESSALKMFIHDDISRASNGSSNADSSSPSSSYQNNYRNNSNTPTNSSQSPSKQGLKSPVRSPSKGAFLPSVFLPILKDAYLGAPGAPNSNSLLEVCGGLESCEKSCPGITESLVREMLLAIQPELGNQIKQTMSNMRR